MKALKVAVEFGNKSRGWFFTRNFDVTVGDNIIVEDCSGEPISQIFKVLEHGHFEAVYPGYMGGRIIEIGETVELIEPIDTEIINSEDLY